MEVSLAGERQGLSPGSRYKLDVRLELGAGAAGVYLHSEVRVAVEPSGDGVCYTVTGPGLRSPPVATRTYDRRRRDRWQLTMDGARGTVSVRDGKVQLRFLSRQGSGPVGLFAEQARFVVAQTVARSSLPPVPRPQLAAETRQACRDLVAYATLQPARVFVPALRNATKDPPEEGQAALRHQP